MTTNETDETEFEKRLQIEVDKQLKLGFGTSDIIYAPQPVNLHIPLSVRNAAISEYLAEHGLPFDLSSMTYRLLLMNGIPSSEELPIEILQAVAYDREIADVRNAE